MHGDVYPMLGVVQCAGAVGTRCGWAADRDSRSLLFIRQEAQERCESCSVCTPYNSRVPILAARHGNGVLPTTSAENKRCYPLRHDVSFCGACQATRKLSRQ